MAGSHGPHRFRRGPSPALALLSLALLSLASISLACAPRASAARGASETDDGMRRIPAGMYETGSDSSEVAALAMRYAMSDARVFFDEMPRRQVEVRPFRLDVTLVSKARYRDFLQVHHAWQKDSLVAREHNGRYLQDWTGLAFPEGEAERPVVHVTWHAARAFCAWEGRRLPTEAEWEWAARGGLVDPEFPWGNAMPDATRANWSGARLGRASDVRAFPPNGYGLYDMAGNAWQFLEDAWSVGAREGRVPPAPAVRPSGDEASSERRVIRGGSFEAGVVNLRVRYRDSHPAVGAGKHVGFRCARSD